MFRHDPHDLWNSAISGDLERVKYLLDNGTAVDAEDADKRTALHWAAANGRIELVEFLVNEKNANINHADEDKWTPLMSAASAGHADVVNFLLSKGASVNAVNNSKRYPSFM